MEVDFSQIGQNVALQNPQQPERAKVNTTENQSEEVASRSREQQNSKVFSPSADESEALNSEAVNIESAVAEVSEFVQSQNRQLAFSIDEKSERPVVKVTDSESGEVIRQIPSEEILALSERIKDLQSDVGAAVGVLFNKQA